MHAPRARKGTACFHLQPMQLGGMFASLSALFRTSACLFGIALALTSPQVVAFTLRGSLPSAAANAKVEVLRESLEARSLTPIASTQLDGNRLAMTVDTEPGLFTVTIGDAKGTFVAAGNQVLTVAAGNDGKTLTISGAPDQEAYLAYEKFRAASLSRLVLSVRESIRAARAAGNQALVEKLTEDEIAGYNEHRRELNGYTLDHLKGSAALYAASLRWDGDHRLPELAALIDDYASRHANTEIARLLKERIRRFQFVSKGSVAPELSASTPSGKPLALSSLRGKVVLVDFWASWCAPCRMENRHYVEAYRAYRDRGFEILAVSVDTRESDWKAAIAKDQATWLHISDLTGWKTPLAGAYNVSALPASFLLDREGKIVAKDLRGGRLAKAIEAALQ